MKNYKIVLVLIIVGIMFIGYTKLVAPKFQEIEAEKSSIELDAMDNQSSQEIPEKGLVMKFKYESLYTETINGDSVIQGNGLEDMMSPIHYMTDYKALEDINPEFIPEVELEVGFNHAPIIKKIFDGYLIGRTGNGQDEKTVVPLIYKLDLQGNLLWQQVYSPLVNGGSMTNLYCYENGHIGFTIGSGDGGKAYFYKCNSEGELSRREVYDDPYGALYKYVFVIEGERLLSIGEGVGRALALSRSIKEDENRFNHDIVATLINAEGKIISSKNYGGFDWEYCRGADYESGVGCVFTGWSNSMSGELVLQETVIEHKKHDYVACIDEDLALKWVVNSKDEERYNYDQITIRKGNVYIAGSKRSQKILGAYRTQVTFWQQFNQEGKCMVKAYDEEFLGGPEVLCVLQDDSVILASGNMNTGWLSHYDASGEKIQKIQLDFTPDSISATEDHGFIIKTIRSIKTIPQPLYISMIWMDTEVVISKYSKELEVEWRKTYDEHPDATETDLVFVAGVCGE